MRKKHKGHEFINLFGAGDRTFLFFLSAIIIFCLAVKIFVCPVRVTGDSMYPTLKDGQLVRAERASEKTPIRQGDIIVIRNSGTGDSLFIKRCVAVPGDTVDIKDGALYVNGVREEGFAPMTDTGALKYPVTLKDDEYFCLGDNRSLSYDSRQFGPVRKKDIKYLIKQEEKT